MLELVNENHLIKGQIYCVKHKFLGRKDNLIFSGGSFFKYPNNNYEFQMHLCSNIYYKYVSKEEYFEKLKEKYDAKCLNIVLKRLIDESFQW